ncbi:cytochrome P450 [Aspergillus unguis]
MAAQLFFSVPHIGFAFGYTVLASAVYIALIGVYRSCFHPLRNIPGPRLASVTELWRTFKYFRGTWHDDIVAAHRQYGSVVRISPNEVSVVHPDLASTVYSHGKGTRKTGWYDTWKRLAGSSNMASGMFNTTDPEQHAFLRKRTAAVYTTSYISSLDTKVQPVMDLLLRKFENASGGIIDLSHWSSLFAYDVVSKLCLGETMGAVQNGRDPGHFIKAIQDAFYWTGNTGFLPGQSTFIMHPLTICVGKVVKRIQENQLQSEKGESDMLDHFLSMKDANGEPATMEEIMVEIGNLLAAGADTTSVAIKAVLGPLLRDRKRYNRLRKEIDEAMSNSDQGRLPYSTLKDLPFLSACIKEGLRMHPSITYQLPREVPEEGISFDGYFIPPSATISMSAMAQNRCQAVFGADAETWRPERWIPGEGSSEEAIRGMEKNIATFGYGSRTCIGKNLALFEIYKYVSQLLLKFDVELVDPDAEWKVRSLWFSVIEGMIIKVQMRES